MFRSAATPSRPAAPDCPTPPRPAVPGRRNPPRPAAPGAGTGLDH
ncbi:hypothetical protein KPATCC21470_3382 [Kitasatospora purpeofusca]